MFDRESMLPLTLGALFAVAVHFLLLPAMAQSLASRAEAWPDLQVDSIEAPARVKSETTVRVGLLLENRGTAATPESVCTSRIYLSSDDRLSDDDQLLTATLGTTFLSQPPMKPGDIRQVIAQDVTLPVGREGRQFLIAVADVHNDIDEGPHESNNTFVQPIEWIAAKDEPKPDLVLLAAASPQTAKPGAMIAVEFAIGGGSDSEPVSTSWFDGVFLSTDDKLDATDTLLTAEPGPASTLRASEAYSRRISVRFEPPSGAGDQVYLLFAADHLNRVAESNETNNLLARAVRIIRPDQPRVAEPQAQGAADLHIPVFSAVDSAMIGETVNLDYVVANRGNGSTKTGKWTDRVYISTDDKLDEADVLLATFERDAVLASGGHYASRMTGRIDLPEEETGERFLIIKTDAGDAVEESDEKNNTAVRPIEINQLVIGKDKQDDTKLAVAWIAYDDFRKLIAPASEVEQPALQSKVDPVKGASTPRDPSPPSQPQPQPVEVAQAKKQPTPDEQQPAAAKQPKESDEPADPAKRIEAKSLVIKPAPSAIEQPRADAVATLPVTPRPQVAAEGPSPRGNPVKQPAADAPKATAGTPATQTQVTLPEPIAPIIDAAAPRAAPDGDAKETRDPSSSDVTAANADPAKQPRADTTRPTQGGPARLARADAPPSPTGDPTKLVPAETPDPKQEGRPTTSPPQDGKDQPEPKPAASSNDSAKTPPKATEERTVKPVPPTQPSNPTSAPRDESDVPPTILEEKQHTVEPGGVITRPGIKITAATPNITTPSWLVSGPTAANPIARVTFDRTGKVVSVDFLKSTGHANLDSPIKASFFGFKASGEALKKVRDTFSIEIKLLLKSERD